jgi:class 3 adenylate cyclase
MGCHACRTVMNADDRFCAGCGTPAAHPLCPACRHPNRPDVSYCVQCGLNLSAASARKALHEPAGELKYVTLLRADLVDSTGLVAGLGPEQVMARLEPSLSVMRAAVRGFGGIVAKELGDGLLGAFGAPQADDNHATLACHAAMDLVRRIDGLNDARIMVRVGLHSGMVVAQMTKTEFSSIYDFRGPALILLERLQAAAEPGQIYLSEACRKLALGHITVETLAPRPLKGFSAPVPLHRVTGTGDPSRWRVRAARGVSRFVGRDGELATLAQTAGKVTAESGQAACLIGDPGIGKSRLVHEFLDQLRESGWRIIEAECSPTAQAAPYAALKNLMAPMLSPEPGTAADPRAGLSGLWRAALDALFDRPVAAGLRIEVNRFWRQGWFRGMRCPIPRIFGGV